MNPIIDAENEPPRIYDARQKKPLLKMVFHFPRVLDADIPVEAETEGACLDKALAERMKQCKPIAVKGEVVE